MKKTILLLIAVSLFSSCKKEPVKEVKPVLAEKIEADQYKEYYGSWVGDFVASDVSLNAHNYSNSNKITLIIKKIENNKAYGQSIVSGNNRPMVGEIKKLDNGLEFILKEPGDDKYDGVFEFSIIDSKLMGIWHANDKNAQVLSRRYELAKQEFKYDPNVMLPEEGDYVDYYTTKTVSYTDESDTVISQEEAYRTASDIITKLNASTTPLTEDSLKNLKKLELEIIRNTIYARHGFTFKKRSFRQFFDPVDWYMPISNDVTAELTSLEKENIKLLNRFEKYAEDNYDTFGR